MPPSATGRASGAVEAIFASPPPVAFWRRDLVWREGDCYRRSRYDPLGGGFGAVTRLPSDQHDDPLVREAIRRDPELRKFLRWSILPQAEVDRARCSARCDRRRALLARGARSRLARENRVVPTGCRLDRLLVHNCAHGTRGEHLVRADRGFATGGGVIARLIAPAFERVLDRDRSRTVARRHRSDASGRRPAPARVSRAGADGDRRVQELDGAGPAGDVGLGRLVQGVDAGRMVEPRPGRRFSSCSRSTRSRLASRAAPRGRSAGSMRWPIACATMRRGKAKANIAAHYDLGNDFYSAWLDPTMTYSSARFAFAGPALEAAQRRKIALLLDRLELKPGQRLLEIGCGWGSLAIEAAKRGRSRGRPDPVGAAEGLGGRQGRRSRAVGPDRNPAAGLSRHRRAVRRGRVGRDGRRRSACAGGAPISTASPAT